MGLNQARDFGFFMLGSYPAILRNIGGSTRVPAYAWNNAWRGTNAWSVPQPVKLGSGLYSIGVM